MCGSKLKYLIVECKGFTSFELKLDNHLWYTEFHQTFELTLFLKMEIKVMKDCL